MQGYKHIGEFDQDLDVLEQYVDTNFRKLNRTNCEIRNEHKHTRQRHSDGQYMDNEPER